MTQDEIIEMWKNSGDLEIIGMPYSKIEAFAKLVAARTLMNIDPSKFMSYQEGFEAGAAKEREACAKVCETEWSYHEEERAGKEFAAAIRARGEA